MKPLIRTLLLAVAACLPLAARADYPVIDMTTNGSVQQVNHSVQQVLQLTARGVAQLTAQTKLMVRQLAIQTLDHKTWGTRQACNVNASDVAKLLPAAGVSTGGSSNAKLQDIINAINPDCTDTQKYLKMLEQVQNFVSAAENQQQLWQQTEKLLAQRQWTFDDLVKYQVAEAQTGDTAAESFLKQANDAMGKVARTYATVRKLEPELNNSTGIDKTLQVIGGYLDVIADNMGQANQYNSLMATAAANQMHSQAVDQELTQVQRLQIQNQIIQNYNNFNKALSQMGGTSAVPVPGQVPLDNTRWSYGPTDPCWTSSGQRVGSANCQSQ